MKLRQLRYFAEIVESGSLSEASRRLHVVQPALSRSLADLEAELTTPLLVRSRVGVQPTAAGQLLHAQARLIARQVETAAALVRECGKHPQGKVSIGVLRSDASALAGVLFRTMQQELPLVTSEPTVEPEPEPSSITASTRRVQLPMQRMPSLKGSAIGAAPCTSMLGCRNRSVA